MTTTGMDIPELTHTNKPRLCAELYRHHWSIANTLPDIDCTSPNYICSDCHCRATVKYLSRERSEATGRSHVSSGPSTTGTWTQRHRQPRNPISLLGGVMGRCRQKSARCRTEKSSNMTNIWALLKNIYFYICVGEDVFWRSQWLHRPNLHSICLLTLLDQLLSSTQPMVALRKVNPCSCYSQISISAGCV